ncbi:MAG: hypothetical protein AAF366_22420 [Pseudomonadota bacterium]
MTAHGAVPRRGVHPARTIVSRVALLACAALAVLVGAPAKADCPVPPPVDPGPVDDVKDRPAYYWRTGVWFRMPLGYHNPQGPERIIPS